MTVNTESPLAEITRLVRKPFLTDEFGRVLDALRARSAAQAG